MGSSTSKNTNDSLETSSNKSLVIYNHLAKTPISGWCYPQLKPEDIVDGNVVIDDLIKNLIRQLNIHYKVDELSIADVNYIRSLPTQIRQTFYDNLVDLYTPKKQIEQYVDVEPHLAAIYDRICIFDPTSRSYGLRIDLTVAENQCIDQLFDDKAAITAYYVYMKAGQIDYSTYYKTPDAYKDLFKRVNTYTYVKSSSPKAVKLARQLKATYNL